MKIFLKHENNFRKKYTSTYFYQLCYGLLHQYSRLQDKHSPKEPTTPTVMREKNIPDLSLSADIYPPWQISAIPKPKNQAPPPTPCGERLTPAGMLRPGKFKSLF